MIELDTQLCFIMAHMNASWKNSFDLEIERARLAQAQGNLGQARVCARRAAGAAAGEYLRRKGLPDAGPSAIDRLRYLAEQPDLPSEAQPLIERVGAPAAHLPSVPHLTRALVHYNAVESRLPGRRRIEIDKPDGKAL